jgi:hypothetical protein
MKAVAFFIAARITAARSGLAAFCTVRARAGVAEATAVAAAADRRARRFICMAVFPVPRLRTLAAL